MEDLRIQENLLERLALLQKNYEANLGKTKEIFDDEAIHDLRVCIRRLLAFVRFIDCFCESETNLILRTRLKKNIKLFNKLRDIQVQIDYLINFIKKFPETLDFLVSLKKQEKKQIKKLRKILITNEFDLGGDLFFYRLELRNLKCFNSISYDRVFELAKATYVETESAISNIIENDFSTYHRTRLAFKRFRYTIETVQNILLISNERLKELQNIQTILGEIQDYTVMLGMFSEFLKKEGKELLQFQNFVEFIQQKRKLIVEDFWNKLNFIEFWRNFFMEFY